MRLMPRPAHARLQDMPRRRFYILAALLLALIAATWLVTLKMVEQERVTAIAAASRETANLAKALEEHVARTVLAADAVLHIMKNRLEANLPLDQATLEETLRSQEPILTVLGVADAEGMVTLNAPVATRFGIADRPHFRAHIERDSGALFIGPPQIGRVSGRWSVNVSRRVNHADGSFAGVVIAGIDVEYFGRFYKEVDLGADSVINVIGRDGIVRLHRDGNGYSAGQTLHESPVLQRAAAGEIKGTQLLTAPVDGTKRIASFRALEKLPLVVIVAQSEREALRGFEVVRRNYYIGASALTLALLLVGVLAALALRAYQTAAAIRLEQSERRYQLALDTSRLAMWEWDVAADQLSVSQLWPAMLGHPASTRTMSIAELRRHLHPDDADGLRDDLIQVLKGQLPRLEIDYRLRTLSSGWLWCHASGEVLERDAANRALRLVGTQSDISARKLSEAALRLSEERFRQFANNIPLILWMSDPLDQGAIYVSPAGQRMLGAEATRSPRKLAGVVHPDDRRRIRAARRRAGEGRYDEIFRVKRVDGAWRWVHDRAFPVHDEHGELVRIAGITEDITDQRLAEERIAYASQYDALTGLPNRVLFHQRLTAAMAGENRHGVVVILIDADHFKKINDTLGHTSGDELLKQLTERLLRTVRPDDLVARMGGDEFAMLLWRIPDAAHAERLASAIVAAMRPPCHFDGDEVHMSISVGIAMAGRDGADADTLLRNADAAMYGAKNAGRNTHHFYHAEMTLRAVELLRLENSLRRALEREEFALHYQPKARMSDGQVIGFEALLRWEHPERGMVSPVEFIPVLEETGLIVAVGEWVIREACAQLRTWEKQGMGNFPVAINVSARQFAEQDFSARVKHILDEEMIDPRMIELEITESVLIARAEDAISSLQALKLLGISVSVDDFGTGYSSLSYLKRFPLDALKIDRSFVRDIPDDLDDAAIVRTIIAMAHGLRLKVIAEGVERPEQMRFLADHGCDVIQGYLLSKPQPGQVWTDLYAKDPALVSQNMHLHVAKEMRQARE